MQTKTDKMRKRIWTLSLILLGISLLSPAYCTNGGCDDLGAGLACMLLGWLGALFMGGPYIAWFANPFLIAAIFTNRKVPLLSFIFALIALAIGLTFLKGGEVLINEAGHKEYITGFHIGYWLWLGSMVLLAAASTIGMVNKNKN